MSRRGLSRLLPVALAGALLLMSSYGWAAHSAEYDRAAEKFARIAENGKRTDPSPEPTVVTAAEWNAYLNEGGVKLPPGLSKIRITSDDGMAHGEAEVDFDLMTSSRTRKNPFLALFTGKHHVTATADLSAAQGIATVEVQSVNFDGVEIPRVALEYFADRFLRPKYGSAVGTNATFLLHNRIETATVGKDAVTVTQR
jgi:hypothetical protein